MLLDMVKVDRLRHAWPLIQFAHIVADGGIIRNTLTVGFEVSVVDRIKADQRREQPPVSLRQSRSSQVTLPGQNLLYPIQCIKKLVIGFLVGLLRGSKSGPIDPIVDRVINALINSVNLCLPRSRIVVRLVTRHAGKGDRKSTRLNSSHVRISYAVFCLKKKN